MWNVYLLKQIDGQKTYVGATLDVERRLKQHNRLLSGGAKATQGHQWERICHVSGFPNEKSALQFEWAWKYYSKKQSGSALKRRIKTLLELFGCEKPTNNATDFQEYVDQLNVIWESDKSEMDFL